MGGSARKPDWFKVKYVKNKRTEQVSGLMKEYNLHSVCQSAHCPNCPECWSQGTASFMIMGEFCTRGCRFCAVKTMAKPPPPDPEEPEHLAEALSTLNLRYVVITSVARDDLKDGGAGHFADCVKSIRKRNPELLIETLIPDFRADESAMEMLTDSKPDVISHNIETIERLTPRVRDLRANYAQSLEVLKQAHEISDGRIITKSGMMVGLGETKDEVKEAMMDLITAGVGILTIGQYLSPSPRHIPLDEYVPPETFDFYEKMGYALGFTYVASGPLVRSSYRAAEPFIKRIIKSRIH